MQIIVAGTQNGAQVCGLGKKLGTIEPGKIADIIIVNDNPLENLDALLNIRLVMKGGQIITKGK